LNVVWKLKILDFQILNRPFTGNEYFGFDVMKVVANAISDFLGQKFYAYAIPD
jgi:hypothetical protein